MSVATDWVRRLVVAMGAAAALAAVAGCGDDDPKPPAPPTFEPTLKMTATEAP